MLVGVDGFATGNATVIIVTIALQGGAYGLAFGGSLRHLTAYSPAERRGAVMSMFHLLAYGALITPTLLVGIGATVWGDTAIFPPSPCSRPFSASPPWSSSGCWGAGEHTLRRRGRRRPGCPG
ncbi:hypothetical protein [Streptomyces sp. WAC 06725]|uniref:hypothetical protein n=1 Tax=Streptomyces sp. WAC 06725 TaxID=2203209 RepID=UPI0021AD8452|nr:hypothetical protein [Streptomyces sp. WAC 06725]